MLPVFWRIPASGAACKDTGMNSSDGTELDLARLATLESIGRPEQLRPLIDVFNATAESRLARLVEIGAGGDLPTLKSVAHDLAGVAGNFGARRVDHLARRLMSECDIQDRQRIAATLAEVTTATAAALAALRARYFSDVKPA